MAMSKAVKLTNFNFRVEIGTITMKFQKVSGYKLASEEITYRDGDDGEGDTTVPGRPSKSDVTAEYGLDFSQQTQRLLELRKAIHDPEKGANGSFGWGSYNYLTLMTLTVLDRTGEDALRYEYTNGVWLKELNFGDYDASANALAIASLIFSPQGIPKIDVLLQPKQIGFMEFGIGGPVAV